MHQKYYRLLLTLVILLLPSTVFAMQTNKKAKSSRFEVKVPKWATFKKRNTVLPNMIACGTGALCGYMLKRLWEKKVDVPTYGKILMSLPFAYCPATFARKMKASTDVALLAFLSSIFISAKYDL